MVNFHGVLKLPGVSSDFQAILSWSQTCSITRSTMPSGGLEVPWPESWTIWAIWNHQISECIRLSFRAETKGEEQTNTSQCHSSHHEDWDLGRFEEIYSYSRCWVRTHITSKRWVSSQWRILFLIKNKGYLSKKNMRVYQVECEGHIDLACHNSCHNAKSSSKPDHRF